jgi:hypothetical protein
VPSAVVGRVWCRTRVPTLAIEGLELVVHLSRAEKLAALHRDARFALSSVTDVAVEPNVWAALRGIRAPGTGLPYVIAYGTRRWPGGKDLALVRGGKRPGLRVDFNADAPYARLVVTVADPQASAAMIRSATGSGA